MGMAFDSQQAQRRQQQNLCDQTGDDRFGIGKQAPEIHRFQGHAHADRDSDTPGIR
ncbi:MAG: hypothetical protein R3F38_11965 [Gammaproteobacteria bacterium]